MTPEFYHTIVLPIAAFVIGACVGSFLNVVIYRVPLGLSVNEPKRSFCPHCRTSIPGWLNIPLVTWLMLGGKCKWCRAPISPRYFVVELLTALLFLAAWQRFVEAGYGVVFAYVILLSLLVAATFIDIDHLIIPDSITLGGLAAGLACSAAFPALHGEASHWRSLAEGVAGAAVGYGLLWAVVNLGKLAFGRLRYEFETPAAWEIAQPDPEQNPVIRIGEAEKSWDDVFFRDSDRLVIQATESVLNGEVFGEREVVIKNGGVQIGERSFPLSEVKSISGKCLKATVPREAMGFGDVKFIAMIGAFLGWPAVLFTVFVAAVTGAVIGLLQKLVAREEWARPLPFGPYLVLGAILWVFSGEPILGWYLRLLGFGG